MFFFSKYQKFSIKFQIFSLAITAFCLPSFSTMTYASKADDGSNISASPNSSNVKAAKKIQKEAYDYQEQVPTSADVKNINIQEAFLKKTSEYLVEGSFILKNKANKDFLLKSISAEKCKQVGQFQDNQTSIEATEETSDAAGNIFKNLPIAHLNTIAFPFSSFHLACIPKDGATFAEGTDVPLTFHFQEGDRTYHFIVNSKAK